MNEIEARLASTEDQVLLLGPDLTALISEFDSTLSKIETVTSHPSLHTNHASFRLLFSNGRELKGRRVASATQARRVMQLSLRLGDLPFARVLAQRGNALLEDWIDGAVLSNSTIEPADYVHAGTLLGRLSRIETDPNGEVTFHGVASKLDKLRQHLDVLAKAKLIKRTTIEQLYRLAVGNAPSSLEIGIVHHDLQPSNLLRRNEQLWAIDPELLETDVLDTELARSLYLWQMSDPDRQRFLHSYQCHRPVTTFIQHELFWAIVTVAAGVHHRHQIGHVERPQTNALVALASGHLPSPWVSNQVAGQTPRQAVKRRIRIAVICDYLALGGQERVILTLLKGLDRSRFSPFAYAFRGGEMAAAIEAERVPLTIGSLKDPLGWHDWSDEDAQEKKQWRVRLAETLRRDRIDAAFIFAWNDGIDAAREAGVSVLIERLDGPKLLSKIPDKSAFDKLICESATIRLSLLERTDELGLDANRLELIYSGIDLEQFNPDRYDHTVLRGELGLAEDEIAIGSIGRLTPGKNVELLMQALKLLRPDMLPHPVRLLIMGPEGGSSAELRQLSDGHNLLRDRVLFLEPHVNVAPVMAALDIFAMTSRSEGLPNVVLEAMAMGLPIVSTRVGSIHEVIHGNGLLANSAEPSEIASCLYRLIKHEDQRRRMAHHSRKVAQRFGLRATIGRYEDLVLDQLQRG